MPPSTPDTSAEAAKGQVKIIATRLVGNIDNPAGMDAGQFLDDIGALDQMGRLEAPDSHGVLQPTEPLLFFRDVARGRRKMIADAFSARNKKEDLRLAWLLGFITKERYEEGRKKFEVPEQPKPAAAEAALAAARESDPVSIDPLAAEKATSIELDRKKDDIINEIIRVAQQSPDKFQKILAECSVSLQEALNKRVKPGYGVSIEAIEKLNGIISQEAGSDWQRYSGILKGAILLPPMSAKDRQLRLYSMYIRNMQYEVGFLNGCLFRAGFEMVQDESGRWQIQERASSAPAESSQPGAEEAEDRELLELRRQVEELVGRIASGEGISQDEVRQTWKTETIPPQAELRRRVQRGGFGELMPAFFLAMNDMKEGQDRAAELLSDFLSRTDISLVDRERALNTCGPLITGDDFRGKALEKVQLKSLIDWASKRLEVSSFAVPGRLEKPAVEVPTAVQIPPQEELIRLAQTGNLNDFTRALLWARQDPENHLQRAGEALGAFLALGAEVSPAARVSAHRLFYQLEMPGQPVPSLLANYFSNWEGEFGEGERIGGGGSGQVYRLRRYPDTVVKVFNTVSGDNTFLPELRALEKLRDVPNVVRLLGHSASGVKPPYLVKEFVDGRKASNDLIDLMVAIRPGTETYEHQQEMALWLISAMEALSKIHARKVLVNDFHFSDYLWVPSQKMTVIIDLANAVDMSAASYDRVRTERNDINPLLNTFFYYATTISKELGMTPQRLSDDCPHWIVLDQHIRLLGTTTREFPDEAVKSRLKAFSDKLGQTGGSPALKKVFDLYLEMHEGADHSAQEFAGAFRDYFREVGLV